MKSFCKIIITFITLLGLATLQSNAQTDDFYFEKVQLIRIGNNGLYGLRDDKNIIIPCEFNEVEPPYNPYDDGQRNHYYFGY